MSLTDTHTHSNFSRDSKTTIEQATLAAMHAKMGGISFTDHMDIVVPEGSIGDYYNIEEQQAAIKECSQKYGTRILLYSGIEVGLQLHCLEEIQQIVSSHNFDIVIGSIHWVNQLDPYRGQYYVGKSLKEAYREYLEYYIQCISKFRDFDVMGHYDYISRYSQYKEKTLTYSAFGDELDTLLKIIIENGKALELNTGSLRSRHGQAAPEFDPNVFKRFRELGGEMVTLGSDAHDTDRIGADFAYYAAQLKQCGLRYITHFKERKPIFTPIKI